MEITWEEMHAEYVQRTTNNNVSQYIKKISIKIAQAKRKNKILRGKWTKKEVMFLKNLARNEGVITNAAEFARKYYIFFPKRSVGGIKNKIYHLGLYINSNR